MVTFKAWIISLCGATALTSLFKILLSNSSLNKVLNIFFSLFVLFYTIIPMQTVLDKSFSIKDFEKERIASNDMYKEGYEQIVELSIKNVCEKENVKVVSCVIDSYIDEDGFLAINQITIEIDKKEYVNLIQENLKKQLNYEVYVK